MMGIAYNTSIVRNGLVLHLDAANLKSYPGTGTSWNDLSGLGNNGTLVNGVGYSTDNKGAMVFDGTNDSLSVSTTPDITGNSPWTISIWANVNASEAGTGRKGWLFWHGPSSQTASQLISMSVTGERIEIAHWSNDTTFSNAIVSLGSWSMYTCTFDGTTENVYVNGVLCGTKTTTLAIVPGTWYIGSRPTADYLNMRTSAAQIYNRALSATEVKQNFEALRGRYGV